MGSGDAVEIADLVYSSERAGPGSLFFCVPGFTADGHDFAVRRGRARRGRRSSASARWISACPRSSSTMRAQRWRRPPRASSAIRRPSSTSWESRARTARRRPPTSPARCSRPTGARRGLLGTVGVDRRRAVEREVKRTTPEAIDLQRTFREMLDAGDRACAMEVSSHALELRRTDGVRFACRVFTNLTQDHLDFHPDMEAYFAAKRRLFEGDGPADRERGRSPTARGSPASSARARRPMRSKRTPTTGQWPSRPTAAAPASYARRPAARSRSSCRCPGASTSRTRSPRSPPPRSLGVGLDAIASGLAGAQAVPGRFEAVDEGQSFTVLVDYAHTPDSLERALRSARELTDGRLIAVFGAGGDRDRGKRPLMGEVGARLADRAIVTSDNPRSEDPAGDHRRGGRRSSGRGSRRSSTVARRSRRRSRAQRPATLCSSRARGTSRARSSRAAGSSPSTTSACARDALGGERTGRSG